MVIKHVLLLICAVTVGYGQNLLPNSDFESGISGWNCWGFKCDIVHDAHSGHNAVKVSSRTQFYQGPSQILHGLKQNTKYQASAYVKMLSDKSGGQKIEMEVAFTFSDHTKQFLSVAFKNGLTSKSGYVHLTGTFTTPNRAFTETMLYFQGPLPGLDFEVDTTSLQEASGSGTHTTHQSSGNMLVNTDFESGSTGWSCGGFTCQIVSDAHHGSHALKASHRTQYYQGPSQDIKGLQPNSQYEIGSYVKMATDLPGDVVGQKIYMEVAITFTDGKKAFMDVAGASMVLKKDGFVKLHGDFATPSRDFKNAYVYFQGPIAGQEFIVDSVFIKPIPDNKNWRSDTDHVIKTTRQHAITVNVHHGNLDTNKMSIQINQIKKSYPFGTAVVFSDYVHGDQRYQDFINKHFNWAVPENALKWDIMERSKGQINKQTAMSALQKLKSHGIKIRGHNIVWSDPRWIQGWLKSLSPTQLKSEVSKRIKWVVEDTKNYVEHWDVNNENLHGQFFQRAVHDRDYNLEIFREAHKAGPNIKLFLNEFAVVTSGSYTEPYLRQALRFKNSNTGLYGLGVQCHFSPDVAPNPTLIKTHLDLLAKSGLPIWVTELDVPNNDEHVRADRYETALRALYGHPAVEGIMLWGFWSKRHFRGEQSSLVSGDGFRLNAAGQRVLNLLEKEWMTHTTVNVGHVGSKFTVHGFPGDYELKVIYNGQERTDLKQRFSVGKGGKTVTVNA